MIPVQISTVFTFIIFGAVLFVSFLWLKMIWRQKMQDWSLSKEKMIVCDSCNFAFIVKNDENISRCPVCNHICIMRKRRKF